nr:PREDICTED: solute carrier family 23 member 2-like [Latimeria chalumnae]|eukprot:XP_005991386.1 PREDICTED: solute carrier family 23 member 2-like [Latimeria chalumnae]
MHLKQAEEEKEKKRVIQTLHPHQKMMEIMWFLLGKLPTCLLSCQESSEDDTGHIWTRDVALGAFSAPAETSGFIMLFSQYLRNVGVPVPACTKTKKGHVSKMYVFQIFPVLLGISISWLVCYILTITNVLPSDPKMYGYMARTDLKKDTLNQAPWFLFPYPGQWGFPTVSLAGVFGILAGVISSMIESVGDYHACARLSGALPPPKHAINRGIGIEGIGCLLAGAWGTGNGTTSYSENVGALAITKVGSRTVIATSGVLMLLMGVFGKIGAVFTTIPTPVIGGMFLVMFGIITAVGISNLQFVDMNSSRNIFIFGFSMFTGLVIPNWIKKNPLAIETGLIQLDQVMRVLLTTSMFVGGFFGFMLDNTVPGSKEERGIIAWKEVHDKDLEETLDMEEVYNLPFGIGTKRFRWPWFKYLPFLPNPKPGCLKKEESVMGINDEKQHKADTHEGEWKQRNMATRL